MIITALREQTSYALQGAGESFDFKRHRGQGAERIAMEIRGALTFHRILLATDFSPSAVVATEFATALARRFSATLELMTVIDLSSTTMSFEAISGSALSALRHSAEENFERWRRPAGELEVQEKAIEGFLASSEILDEALEFRADLIVMGTTSKHGLKKFLLGSTAEDVIRNAVCPVLTVGPNVAFSNNAALLFKTILYATESYAPSSRASQYAHGLADEFAAQLCVCHVMDDKGIRRRDEGSSGLASAKMSFRQEKVDGPGSVMCLGTHGAVDEEILRVARHVNAGLIVLGARKTAAWLTCVTNGITPSVITDAESPVLTVSSAVAKSQSQETGGEVGRGNMRKERR